MFFFLFWIVSRVCHHRWQDSISQSIHRHGKSRTKKCERFILSLSRECLSTWAPITYWKSCTAMTGIHFSTIHFFISWGIVPSFTAALNRHIQLVFSSNKLSSLPRGRKKKTNVSGGLKTTSTWSSSFLSDSSFGFFFQFSTLRKKGERLKYRQRTHSLNKWM